MKRQHEIKESKKLSPLCRGDCKLCSSDFVSLVHKMIATGKTYVEISNYLKEEKKFEISSSSIGRHYNNFKEYKRLTLQKKLIAEVDVETDKLVGHQKDAIVLADLVRDQLLFQFTSGNMRVDISDWEKVVKVYHQVLLGKGDGNEGKDLKIIFEQAMNKYGGQQLLKLKFGGNEAGTEQEAEDKKEEH